MKRRLSQAYITQIVKHFVKLSEENDHVTVICQDEQIIKDYLDLIPGKKSLIANKKLTEHYLERTTKNRIEFVNDGKFILKSNNITFVPPSRHIETPIAERGGSFVIVCTPLFAPIVKIIKTYDPFDYAQVCTRRLVQFSSIDKNIATKFLKTPQSNDKGKVLLLTHYHLDEAWVLFKSDEIHLSYDLNFTEYLDHESISRLERQFDIASGSVLSVDYLAGKTWMNKQRIEYILDALVCLGSVQRYIQKKNLKEMYSMKAPVNHELVKDYANEAKQDILFYKDLPENPKKVFQDLMSRVINQHCLKYRCKAVLFFDTVETIDLSQQQVW